MKFSFSNFISVVSLLCLAIASIKGDADKKKNKVIDIDTETLIKYLGNPNALVVDVRTPKEIREAGTFFAAINIPVDDVKKAFGSMSPAKFFCLYGRVKPKKCTHIVFTCRTGDRSANAAEITADLGYTNVFNYNEGWKGWLEYAKKHQPKYTCCPINSYQSCHQYFIC